MSEIHKTYSIHAPIEKVWQALVDPNEIDNWGGGPAQMTEDEGYEFELWGGDIVGENISVNKPSKLVQEWGYGDWTAPSTVTFELQALDGHTEITLTQTGHPKSEHSDLEKGWNDYYLGAIKEYLERG